MPLPDPMTTHTPAEMSKLATSLWKAQQKVRLLQAKLKPLKEAADALEAELLEAMLASKMESVASREATVSVKRTTFAELYDHQKFFDYVRKTNQFDLVRKQPVVEACRLRWSDDVVIPGVRPGTRTDLSVTARSK